MTPSARLVCPRLATWLTLVCVHAAWAQPANPNDVIVAPDSAAMKAVRAQPVTADPYPLLVAMHKFEMAKDLPAAEALRGVLERITRLRLAGASPAIDATIDRLVNSRTLGPAVPAPAGMQSMQAALVPRLATSADGTRWMLGTGEARQRLLPGVWRTLADGRPAEVVVFVELENRSRFPIDGVFHELRMQAPGNEAVELRCDGASREAPVPIPPEGRVLRLCSLHPSEVDRQLPALLLAAQAAQSDPSSIGLLRSGFRFPPLLASVQTDGSLAIGHEDAYRQARQELAEQSCWRRGACWQELAGLLSRFAAVGWILGGGIGFALVYRYRPRRRESNQAPDGSTSRPEPAQASAPARRGWLGPALFGAYLTFLALCAGVVIAQEPWRVGVSGMDGLATFIASAAAGFPGSALLLFGAAGRLGDAPFVVLSWGSALLNVGILGWLCGLWRPWARRPDH